MITTQKFLSTAVVAALVAGSMSLGPAAAAVTPDIIGGTKAPATPWAVQLEFTQDGGTYGCTGEQINAGWVLTARHCADGTTAMNVYHSNSTSRRGSPTRVAALYLAPKGDLALARLSSSHPLSRYPSLKLTYSARSTGTGTIMGYGVRAEGVRPTGLFQATEKLAGGGADAYKGRAQHVTGADGAANHGDSGGPLLVGGAVVAVCSTGDVADPGSNIHAGSKYAILAQSASWIRKTAGV